LHILRAENGTVWICIKKALAHFLRMTEQNRRIGFVRERRDTII
jgi:hypothetical protein